MDWVRVHTSDLRTAVKKSLNHQWFRYPDKNGELLNSQRPGVDHLEVFIPKAMSNA
jgi:hypothetical protein